MRGFLDRYIKQNLSLKLISLLLAVGLWLAVAHDPVAEVAIDVPIEFRHMPTNMEISSESVSQAEIRIRGPERLIHRLSPSDVHVEIESKGITPGERTFDLGSQQVHTPHDLSVVQVVPGQLHVEFDARETKRIPIKPRVVGQFAEGYSIAHITADPPTLEVRGPAKRVAQVEEAITDPVDASGTMQQNTFVTHAYVADPLVQVIHPQTVRVTVSMQKDAGGASQ